MTTIALYDAIKKMRQLTELGIPFSFGFYTYNATKETSSGYRVVDKALLRLGLRRDKSDKASILIAFTDYKESVPRFFYLPLLIEFNGLQITP